MQKFTVFILLITFKLFSQHEEEDLLLGLQSFLILKGVPQVQRNRIETDAKAYDSLDDIINAIRHDNFVSTKYKNLAIFYLNNISEVADQAEIFSLSSKAFDTATSEGLENFLSARAIPKEDIQKVVTSFDLGGPQEAIITAERLGGLTPSLTNEYFELMGEGNLI